MTKPTEEEITARAEELYGKGDEYMCNAFGYGVDWAIERMEEDIKLTPAQRDAIKWLTEEEANSLCAIVADALYPKEYFDEAIKHALRDLIDE